MSSVVDYRLVRYFHFLDLIMDVNH